MNTIAGGEKPMAIIAIRTVIIYIIIIAAMRIMGKRQLGELQPAELVVTLLISDLAAIPMQENGMPLLNGIIPIAVLVSLELLFSGLMLKVPFFHRLIGGKPKIIVNNGTVDIKAMRDIRMTIEDLMESLRQQGTFDIQDVQYAIVESNGKLSILLKPEKRQTACADLKIIPPDNGIPMIIVSDGKVSKWGLSVCGLDQKWLDSVLDANSCFVQDVFLLMADKTRAYHLIRKEQK